MTSALMQSTRRANVEVAAEGDGRSQHPAELRSALQF
jgi:hypothetical protein